MGLRRWQDRLMGPVLILVVLLVVLPPTFMMLGFVLSAIIGWALKDNGEKTHEGSELIDLNT